MKKIYLFLLLGAFAISGCSSAGTNESESENKSVQEDTTKVDDSVSRKDGDAGSTSEIASDSNVQAENGSVSKQPRNVREFFMLLPREYFEVLNCQPAKDKNCAASKQAYLKKHGNTEDLKNGYMEAGGDGAQAAFKLAIFKRKDDSFLVGLNSYSETGDDYKFLEFDEGKWSDISIEVVPEYSTTNIYELPRNGTIVPVFAKEIVEQREGFEVSKKGVKLYDLIWKKGGFSISR